MSRPYDVHLIFNVQDQAEFVDWIDEGLRKRGIRPWLWNRDTRVFDKDEVESIKSTPVSAMLPFAQPGSPTGIRLNSFLTARLDPWRSARADRGVESRDH